MSKNPETNTPSTLEQAETPASHLDAPKVEYKPVEVQTDPTQDNADIEADKALKTIPDTDPTGTGAILDKQINEFVTAIEQQQAPEDLRKKAKTAIFKKGKVREGVKELWSILSGGTNRASEVPLPEIDSTTPLEVLNTKIEELNNAIMKTKEFQKKTDLVSLLSELKRTLYAQQHKHTKPKNEREMLQYMGNSGQIKVGDIINVRNEKPYKRYDKIVSRAITSETQGDRTHTAMISSINPLKIIHADEKVEEIDFHSYADKMSQMDIIIMNTPSEKGTQVVEYARQHIGKAYDTTGMLSKSHGDDTKFFCSELVDKSLRHAGVYNGKPLIAPSETMNILTPSYMGSLV